MRLYYSCVFAPVLSVAIVSLFFDILKYTVCNYTEFILNKTCITTDRWIVNLLLCTYQFTYLLLRNSRHNHFLLPNKPFRTILPTFLSKPCLVVGMPVFRLIFCFAAVISTALLSEKLNPGIFISFLRWDQIQWPQLPRTENRWLFCTGKESVLLCRISWSPRFTYIYFFCYFFISLTSNSSSYEVL